MVGRNASRGPMWRWGPVCWLAPCGTFDRLHWCGCGTAPAHGPSAFRDARSRRWTSGHATYPLRRLDLAVREASREHARTVPPWRPCCLLLGASMRSYSCVCTKPGSQSHSPGRVHKLLPGRVHKAVACARCADPLARPQSTVYTVTRWLTQLVCHLTQVRLGCVQLTKCHFQFVSRFGPSCGLNCRHSLRRPLHHLLGVVLQGCLDGRCANCLQLRAEFRTAGLRQCAQPRRRHRWLATVKLCSANRAYFRRCGCFARRWRIQKIAAAC